MKLRKEFEGLLSLPGIGEILGLTIMLEVGEIRRFPEVGNYSSYCRCVRSTRLSNGKSKGEGNRKNGNKYLKGNVFSLVRCPLMGNSECGTVIGGWSDFTYRVLLGSFCSLFLDFSLCFREYRETDLHPDRDVINIFDSGVVLLDPGKEFVIGIAVNILR